MSNDKVYFAVRLAVPAGVAERFLRLAFLIATGIISLSGSHQSVPAHPVELFRYRGVARDGGTFEYVFEADPKEVPRTVTKERVAEIATDSMTTLYGVQMGGLEMQELRTSPIPFWLISFSGTIKGPLRQLFFVVVIPDGKVVEPRVAKWL
jgi:hypothetical protein